MSDALAPVEDEHGTVKRHVGRCRTCGRTAVRNSTKRGFESADDTLSEHVDETDCDDYAVFAIYVDGGERRVA